MINTFSAAYINSEMRERAFWADCADVKWDNSITTDQCKM